MKVPCAACEVSTLRKKLILVLSSRYYSGGKWKPRRICSVCDAMTDEQHKVEFEREVKEDG